MRCDQSRCRANYGGMTHEKIRWSCLLSLFAAGAWAGCGSDDPCDPAAQSGCESGLACEVVEGGEPACFAPVVIRGQVIDLASSTGVANAHIVALDINGAAASEVAVSSDTGEYELPIPSTRREDGTPVSVELTLRADAAAYQTFPSGLRQSLPIDTSNPEDTGDALVVSSALTDIGLLGLPEGSGQGQIFGQVEIPESQNGMLVVASSADGVGFAAVANRSGGYRIFNVPAGDYEVQAYARGVNYAPQQATLGAAGETEIDLALDDRATGTVSGSVQIVNPTDGSVTSVILVVESTFDDVLARGQTVPGLRAPEPGVAPDIMGNYTLEGVPAGRYVVLAAFENDNLVRDPDISIGGTSTLHIEVTPGETTTVEGFKVTGALEIFGPGAQGSEQVQGLPVFSWKDDSSEAEYQVQVFDSFGNITWETTIPGASGNDPMVEYAGPDLQSGMYYQFRVTSFSNTGTPIARTEDLKGVFLVP